MSRRLTKQALTRMINEERQRIQETLELGLDHPSQAPAKTREVDGSGYADSLEQCIDHYKACCIKEEKLVRTLKRIQESKRRAKRKIQRHLG